MIICFIIFLMSILYSTTLQEAFDDASSYGEYEKFLVLEPNTIYTGGIGIYEGDVYINCMESVIDLESGNGIWIYADAEYPSSLDIEHCTITNGLYYGLSFGGMSEGNVINCNFINTNFGLKLFDESDVFVTNSIFTNNNSMGIGIYTAIPILDANYLLFWNNEDDCLENCPGWGNIWTPLELSPGTGIIYENPQFINLDQLNFELSSTSPCINSGNPNQNLDEDGSISDIGANPYNTSCSIQGDVNNDSEVNVMDIVEVVGCVLDNACPDCSDVNGDGILNVIDIIMIVNIILEND